MNFFLIPAFLTIALDGEKWYDKQASKKKPFAVRKACRGVFSPLASLAGREKEGLVTKVQEATRQETFHIAVGVACFSALMNLVFLLVKRWDLSVLWGTLLGGSWAVFNFFLLGLTVQGMVADPDEKRGKMKLQLSYSLRMLITIGVVILAIQLPGVNWVATVIPLFFTRLTILAMQMLGMYKPDEKKPEHEEGGDGTV